MFVDEMEIINDLPRYEEESVKENFSYPNKNQNRHHGKRHRSRSSRKNRQQQKEFCTRVFRNEHGRSYQYVESGLEGSRQTMISYLD